MQFKFHNARFLQKNLKYCFCKIIKRQSQSFIVCTYVLYFTTKNRLCPQFSEHSFLFIYFMLLFTPNSVTSNDYSHLKFTSHVHSTAYISCHCRMDMGHSDIPWLLHGALVHSVLTHPCLCPKSLQPALAQPSAQPVHDTAV